MTNLQVKKSKLHGSLMIPPSKSQTLRAILFGSLADGESTIKNPLISPDASVMIAACSSMGAKIDTCAFEIKIQGVRGKIEGAENIIDAGNSGIVLRFISAVAALGTRPFVITGDESIRTRRPLAPLIDGIRQLGGSIESVKGNNFAPVIIKGPIQPGKVIILGEDSQPVSALLIAMAWLEGGGEIHVMNPGELPWVGLTLKWFDRLGIRYETNEKDFYKVFGGANPKGFVYQVPGDLSSLAFPMAAAVITGSNLDISNVFFNDPQGDKQVIDVLRKMGANIAYDQAKKMVSTQGFRKLKGAVIDVNPFIDAVPILATVACFAEGKTVINNAEAARHKESDRLTAITKELRKMGADITEKRDGLEIRPSTLKGAHVDSHHDHRIAMSLAVAALASDGVTTISNTKCIDKTFPSFAKMMQTVGGDVLEV